MPIQKCSVNGKSGYKWGASGKCYTGPGGREKAIRQMKAIKVSQSHSAEKISLKKPEKSKATRDSFFSKKTKPTYNKTGLVSYKGGPNPWETDKKFPSTYSNKCIVQKSKADKSLRKKIDQKKVDDFVEMPPTLLLRIKAYAKKKK